MLKYIYVDLTTQRIFRISQYDHRYVPAILDGVLGMVSIDSPQLHDKSASWSKYKGVFISPSVISSEDKIRLEVLNARCEGLELLYRTIYLLRKPYAEALPLDSEIMNAKIQEAQKLISGQSLDANSYLESYAKALSMPIHEAAQLVLFLERDRHALLKQTENLKLEWENIFTKSEDPIQGVALFKTSVYLG